MSSHGTPILQPGADNNSYRQSNYNTLPDKQTDSCNSNYGKHTLKNSLQSTVKQSPPAAVKEMVVTTTFGELHAYLIH